MKERRSKPTSMRAKKEGVVCFVSLCRSTGTWPYRQGQETSVREIIPNQINYSRTKLFICVKILSFGGCYIIDR